MDTRVDRTTGVQGITITGSRSVGTPRSVRCLLGFGSGAQYGVHNASLPNLARGVAERVLYVSEGGKLTPPRSPKAGAFQRLLPLKMALLKYLPPTTVVPREEYPALYTGRKQGIYQRACDSLRVKGIQRKDAYVSTFVKAEKVNFSAKGDPAPRVIQPRSPRFNLEVGRYLKMFEQGLVRGFRLLCGYPVILKCCNADGVAAALWENWRAFKRPVAVGLDASRFDQHISRAALEFEHSVYNAVFKSKELARLLSWQLDNRGFGRVGGSLLTYLVSGCRMSGDINTGMGNCLIMCCLVLNYFAENGVQARLSNNGDDCVVICEQSDLHKLDGLDEYFSDFGFKLTRETPVTVFEQIEFCQSQPVLVGDAYRMVRNPWTAMSKDSISLLGWESEENFNTWRDAIGVCGLELTRGVPVWEAFYGHLLHGARTGGVESVYDSGMGYMARGVKHVGEITAESRVSFWRAFGILPDLQIAMETSLPAIVYHQPTPMKFADFTAFTYNPLRWLERTNPR